MNSIRTRSRIGLAVRITAVALLAGAFLFGLRHRGDDVLPELGASFPSGTQFTKIKNLPLIFEVRSGGGTPDGYLAVETARGYGGPATVATYADPGGRIRRVIVLDHKETPSYFLKVVRNRFFEQFRDRSVTGPFLLDQDVDAVTGATISSDAFAGAVGKGGYHLGNQVLDIPVDMPDRGWNFGANEMTLLGLYAVVLLGVFLKISKLRLVTLAAGCVFLGFYVNYPIALSNISAALLGYVPSLKENTLWWFLVAGTLLFTLVHGRNIYCTWLCPFGAIQEFSGKLGGGINIRLGTRTLRYARHLRAGLTWMALVLIFITSNPSIGSYEPFSTLFGQEGFGVQWYILPLAVVGAFFVNRFWCRFFCPVGMILDLTAKARRRIARLYRRTRSWLTEKQRRARSSEPC